MNTRFQSIFKQIKGAKDFLWNRKRHFLDVFVTETTPSRFGDAQTGNSPVISKPVLQKVIAATLYRKCGYVL